MTTCNNYCCIYNEVGREIKIQNEKTKLFPSYQQILRSYFTEAHLSVQLENVDVTSEIK